ncbi:hypothetical protein ABI59_14750 [Acidobacteria bacterium Mor1]|nr:hypothetical protein ABI59_14750 [Acidobacteria bacterium Mor1]
MATVLSVSLAAADHHGAAQEAAADEPEVVAYLGDQPISLEEIDKLIAGDLMKLRQQKFDLRNEALNTLVLEKLLDAEAARRKMNLAELMVAEVEDKAPAPSAEQVEMYLRKYGDRDPLLKGKEGAEAERMAKIQVGNQLIEERRDEFVREIMAKADLNIMLEPPRIDVRVPGYEPSLGPDDAAVTIVEFSDYQCPYCKRAQPSLDKLLAEFPDDVRLVYRDFPLDFHNEAEGAARAARCAGDQNKYWEYHRHLLTEDGSLERDDLMRRAEAVGLDMTAFTACHDSDRHRDAVKAGLEDGAAVGVTGTPTFFINGRMFLGALPKDIGDLIREEIERADKQ